jgi:aryl-alcohol dehydrogenase-like predicted oxidoreductase
MRTRSLGRLGWPVSEVGYGLWGMGGWSGSDDEQSLAALDFAIEQGCTFFDTALAYGDGKSEQLLAQVLKRHLDKPLVVATKIPPKNRQWPARPDYKIDDVFPAEYIREATEISLTNLGVQTIDLQQFHVWTDEWAGDERWQRAVDDLKSQKLIKGFGISINRWEPTNVLKALKSGVVDSVQVVYNIFDQNAEDELFPICREMKIGVIARVPFDEGSLTGTMTPGMTWPEGDWRNLYFSPDKLPAILDHVEALRVDVPAGMSMPELALRFILSNPDVSTIIPGMRRRPHVSANLGVSDGNTLSQDVMARMREHRWTRTYFVP